MFIYTLYFNGNLLLFSVIWILRKAVAPHTGADNLQNEQKSTIKAVNTTQYLYYKSSKAKW